MVRKRDYKAEYERRIASAAKRGLSRSQARGHARIGEVSLRPRLAPRDSERFEAALKLYRQSGNQAASAKALNLSTERLRRFLRENVEVQGRGRSLKINDSRRRIMPVISNGEMHERVLRDFDQASLNGKHLSAVRAFLTSGEIEVLAPFVCQSVIDAKGKPHLLETNPNTLHRLAAAGSEVFHDIYRLVI